MTLTHLDTTVLDRLDFDPQLPCEAPYCDSGQPVAWRCLLQVLRCDCQAVFLICEPCRAMLRHQEHHLARALVVACPTCDKPMAWRPAAITPIAGGDQ